jgi:hypothetical protein
MTVKQNTARWALTASVQLAWAMARAAERLGKAGVCFEYRLEAVAMARGIDMGDVLAPLTTRLRTAGEA